MEAEKREQEKLKKEGVSVNMNGIPKSIKMEESSDDSLLDQSINNPHKSRVTEADELSIHESM